MSSVALLSPGHSPHQMYLSEASARETLLPQHSIDLHRLRIAEEDLVLPPDLIFECSRSVAGVGDAKYRFAPPHWESPDLYPVLSYTAGCGTREGFSYILSRGLSLIRGRLRFSNITAILLAWRPDVASPREAGRRLAADMDDYLGRFGCECKN